MKKISIKEFVSYNGHNVKSNTTVSLNFKAMYSELTKTIQVLQLLNNDVKITAADKPLGTFRVKNVSVSDDGESTLKFESMADAVEMDNLNSLINVENEVAIVMESLVDLEDGNEELEEDNDNDEVEELEEIEELEDEEKSTNDALDYIDLDDDEDEWDDEDWDDEEE